MASKISSSLKIKRKDKKPKGKLKKGLSITVTTSNGVVKTYSGK